MFGSPITFRIVEACQGDVEALVHALALVVISQDINPLSVIELYAATQQEMNEQLTDASEDAREFLFPPGSN